MRYYTLLISLVIVLVYILELLYPPTVEFIALRPSEFFNQPWTILTSIFAHADYLHIYNNLFFLVIFGLMLERIVNSRFLVLFFAGGLFANISAFIFYPNSMVLGASGAISTIVITYAVLKPRSVGLAFGVPVPMWAAGFIWFLTNILLINANSGIAVEAHLFGAVFGLIAGLYLRKKEGSLKTGLKDGKTEKEGEGGEYPSNGEIEEWEDHFMK